MQKQVVRLSIQPLFSRPSLLPLFNDQYAFRPSGSTVSALISILHHVTTLLQENTYVRVKALDFSKAFDTIRHSAILAKLSLLPVDDIYYKCFVIFFILTLTPPSLTIKNLLQLQ